MKLKKCKICKQEFMPTKPLQSVCTENGFKCAREHAQNNRDKLIAKSKLNAARELKQAKEAIKSRSDWINEAQSVFNKFIRTRDNEESCISCDKPASWGGQWHASHFYATSIRPNLRFNENNVHKACSVCNNYMHGNLTPYRVRLIVKIGIEEMNILDKDISPAKYSIQDLKDMKAHYAKLTKDCISKM